jgi:hypothetical protein
MCTLKHLHQNIITLPKNWITNRYNLKEDVIIKSITSSFLVFVQKR